MAASPVDGAGSGSAFVPPSQRPSRSRCLPPRRTRSSSRRRPTGLGRRGKQQHDGYAWRLAAFMLPLACIIRANQVGSSAARNLPTGRHMRRRSARMPLEVVSPLHSSIARVDAELGPNTSALPKAGERLAGGTDTCAPPGGRMGERAETGRAVTRWREPETCSMRDGTALLLCDPSLRDRILPAAKARTQVAGVQPEVLADHQRGERRGCVVGGEPFRGLTELQPAAVWVDRQPTCRRARRLRARPA